MLKSFDEFLKILTPEKIKEIADSANESSKELRQDSTYSTLLGNQVAGVSLTFTIEVLSLYHEWLSEQL